MTENELRQEVVRTAELFDGVRKGSIEHHALVETYNSHKPLARGYQLKYTDPWCAGFVSAIAIKAGLTDIIPTEVGCGEMIKLYQALGRWIEDDGYTPRPGDIIFYDWDDSGIGDNHGSTDHVGIVCEVSHGIITVIEGNKNDRVGHRQIGVNGKYIRGFGVPDYVKIAEVPDAVKDYDTIARDVIAGKWGNGQDRKDRLTAAGYDFDKVQEIVNDILKQKENGNDLDQFVRDVQAATGSVVDGIAGPQTLRNTPTISRWVNDQHRIVPVLQRFFNEHGYPCGKVDGVTGPKFESAVLKFQKDNGCEVDGVITAKNKTWRKLLGME